MQINLVAFLRVNQFVVSGTLLDVVNSGLSMVQLAMLTGTDTDVRPFSLHVRLERTASAISRSAWARRFRGPSFRVG